MANNKNELPVRVKTLRVEMGVGESYMTALLDACGLKGSRLVLRSKIAGFFAANPGWKMRKGAS